MNKTININNKVFRKYITSEQINQCVKDLSQTIRNRYYLGEELCFIVVLNGAFVFAADLIREIQNRCEIHFVKISSYEGMISNEVRQTSNLPYDLVNKNVIVIEDIVETGQTIDYLIKQIREIKPKSIEVCTLLYKPKKFRADFSVNYVGMEIEDAFVVGYGMDYNQIGRELKDIYQLV
ncbi:MAG: hypoxanthine phosphoribosyltransferase [Bacteroidales bacterium]|jgi:hypoxanthine phosphoribosyltransferase|nr:hypoxanthine phosphoribosyltransferase [Bacteroidales bacterium]